MNLKELIEEVEDLQKIGFLPSAHQQLKGIKQTVEAVDNDLWIDSKIQGFEYKDWQKLKELLGLK